MTGERITGTNSYPGLPMSQFEYVGGYLTVIDTSRWNFAWGFRRVIARIDDL